jgi:HPt (histidine-containing phosphotransfer) domain-containing protein
MHEEQLKGGASTTWVVRPDPDLQDLIPSFMQNRKNELVEIEVALAKSDFESIRRLAHTWKGICRPYGFIHLETLSRRLEKSGEIENLTEAKAIASEIRAYLENVRIVYDS